METNYRVEAIPFDFEYRGQHYTGEASPRPGSCIENVCFKLHLILNGDDAGLLSYVDDQWTSDTLQDQVLVNKIGQLILGWYE